MSLAPAQVEVDPASLDFGTTAPGSPVRRSLVIYNRGAGPLELSELPIVGDGAAAFSVEPLAAMRIAGGENVTTNLVYAPPAAGTHSARLLIRGDAANTRELAVTLSGVAAAGDLCATITCTTPPAAACLDAQTSRTYDAVGSCGAGGACTYVSHDATCSFGCDAATGQCKASCGAGSHPCSGLCVSDTSPQSCGSSCAPCPAPPNTLATCTSGQCGWVCNPGYADCDGLASTGCEVNTQLDSKSCGWCGHDCVWTTCQGGLCQPVTLASGQVYPQYLAVNASAVYFTNYASWSGTVMKVPLGGGAPVTLASGQDWPDDIAVDASAVYWNNTNSTINSTVMKMPLNGGAPVTLASGQNWASRIAVDASAVYWTDELGGTVMKVPLGGGNPVTLASGQSNPVAIAVDAGTVFWATLNPSTGTVMKAPLGGGVPVTLASGQDSPYSIALDAGAAYWVTSGTIMKAPLGGGAPVTLVSGASTYKIAVDAKAAYWTTSFSGTVMKVPLSGGTPVTLASGYQHTSGIAVDAVAVYWTDSRGGLVMKVAK